LRDVDGLDERGAVLRAERVLRFGEVAVREVQLARARLELGAEPANLASELRDRSIVDGVRDPGCAEGLRRVDDEVRDLVNLLALRLERGRARDAETAALLG
jgi:hypothetical protein